MLVPRGAESDDFWPGEQSQMYGDSPSLDRASMHAEDAKFVAGARNARLLTSPRREPRRG